MPPALSRFSSSSVIHSHQPKTARRRGVPGGGAIASGEDMLDVIVVYSNIMDYRRIYNDIINMNAKIRLVTICDNEGKIMYSNHREGVDATVAELARF